MTAVRQHSLSAARADRRRQDRGGRDSSAVEDARRGLARDERSLRLRDQGAAEQPGAQALVLRNVFSGQRLVALLSFGASAWKLAAHERFIGWHEPELRRRNLQLVVNNARYLILQWIESKGLASKILAPAARQLPHDWQRRYDYSPVLLETFVESARHRGIC